jgi:ABC-type phosphate/phosphonate transport system permease subunit
MKAQFIQKWVDWLMEKVGMAGAEEDENVLKNMETLLIALIAIVIAILCTLVIRLFIERVQL